MTKILIVDDEKPTRDVMARILSSKYECLTAPDAAEALKALEVNPDVALVITDYKMPGENGLELIKRVKAKNPAIAAMIITAFGEIDLAVEAMKEGADDFITKPVTDIGALEKRVAKALKTIELEREVKELRTELDSRYGMGDFTGKSPAMERVYTLIRKVAPTDANILIEGPSGSGKELTARAIHNASRRASGPFVAVECSALPPTLLETELFGSIKGAFTDARDRAGCFESANGGTLFLDEIGEISLDVQVKLLRVLETRSFQRVGEAKLRTSDFRLVTATNKDLLALVREGKFREDLYYRLNVIDIRLPALRERPGDIALLASRFLKEFSKANGGSVTGIDPAAMKLLEDYPWPGNVRQLRNAIEKMVVLSSGGKLTVDDVPVEIATHTQSEEASFVAPPAVSQVPAAAPVQATAPAQKPRLASLREQEKEAILAALQATGGRRALAAQRLGISRRTLLRRLNEWNLEEGKED